MGHCVRLILPNLPCLRFTIDGFIGEIVEHWGGVTSWMASGRWGQDVEDVHIVECSIRAWTPQIREWWLSLASRMRTGLGQECIYFSVREETALLIGPNSTETIGD